MNGRGAETRTGWDKTKTKTMMRTLMGVLLVDKALPDDTIRMNFGCCWSWLLGIVWNLKKLCYFCSFWWVPYMMNWDKSSLCHHTTWPTLAAEPAPSFAFSLRPTCSTCTTLSLQCSLRKIYFTIFTRQSVHTSLDGFCVCNDKKDISYLILPWRKSSTSLL